MEKANSNSKQYFVIVYQEESEWKLSHAEKLVYQAIKSFTANGTILCQESYLAISKRAGVSDKWTKQAVCNLIRLGHLSSEGKITKRGGSCPILKILFQSPYQGRKFGVSSNLNKESSESVRLSSKSPSLNYIQSNKVNNKSKKQQILSSQALDKESLLRALADPKTADTVAPEYLAILPSQDKRWLALKLAQGQGVVNDR